MIVDGIGNVVGCTNTYIFLRNEGSRERIKANDDLLRLIYEVADENEKFYSRMWEELNSLYQIKLGELDRTLHYISDDEVKQAFSRSRREGLDLSISQGINNDEYFKKYNNVFGIFDGARYADDKRWEAHKIKSQIKVPR